MAETLTQRIVKTPDLCGGRACIAGHRVRVADIVVWHEYRGYAPHEVVGFFPGLSLSAFHAAMAYYFDNREEIEADLRFDQSFAVAGAGLCRLF